MPTAEESALSVQLNTSYSDGMKEELDLTSLQKLLDNKKMAFMAMKALL